MLNLSDGVTSAAQGNLVMSSQMRTRIQFIKF